MRQRKEILKIYIFWDRDSIEKGISTKNLVISSKFIVLNYVYYMDIILMVGIQISIWYCSKSERARTDTGSTADGWSGSPIVVWFSGTWLPLPQTCVLSYPKIISIKSLKKKVYTLHLYKFIISANLNYDTFKKGFARSSCLFLIFHKLQFSLFLRKGFKFKKHRIW